MLYDRDIREPLFDYLEERYGKVMVLPDRLAGIEIKSDADSYARLDRQVKDYDRYFDRNYVAVGSTHAVHVRERIPEYWGIISVEWLDNQVDFYMVREAEDNPRMDMRRKIQMLWRPELAHIQEMYGMPKYAGKSKEFVRNKIVEKVPEIFLQKQISEELFERDYTIR